MTGIGGILGNKVCDRSACCLSFNVICLFKFQNVSHVIYCFSFFPSYLFTSFIFASFQGGVGISFSFFDSSLCFVVCHLAARKERLEKRRTDFLKIAHGLKLGRKVGCFLCILYVCVIARGVKLCRVMYFFWSIFVGHCFVLL